MNTIHSFIQAIPAWIKLKRFKCRKTSPFKGMLGLIFGLAYIYPDLAQA